MEGEACATLICGGFITLAIIVGLILFLTPRTNGAALDRLFIWYPTAAVVAPEAEDTPLLTPLTEEKLENLEHQLERLKKEKRHFQSMKDKKINFLAETLQAARRAYFKKSSP